MTEEVQNTDREVWRGPDEGSGSYYADSVHLTEDGGLGINVGGRVIVMPAFEWHALATGATKVGVVAQGEPDLRQVLENARQEIVLAIAFLGRDAGTKRIDTTADQLSVRLAKVDADILAVLDAVPAETMTTSEDLVVRDHMISCLRGRNDKLCSDAADEIEQLSRQSPAANAEQRRAEVCAAVAHVLHGRNRQCDYPIYETQDDRGLDEAEYIDFAMDVLASLRSRSQPVTASQREIAINLLGWPSPEKAAEALLSKFNVTCKTTEEPRG